MTYRFGWKWNVRMIQPIDEKTEDEARQAWDAGEQFCVTSIREGNGLPQWTVLIANGADFVKVYRYDHNGSIAEITTFEAVEQGGDRLLLAAMVTYVYPDDADRALGQMDSVAHKSWAFWPDGRASCRETVKALPEVRVTEYQDVDLTHLWVDRPTFGDWERWGRPLDETFGQAP